MEQPPSNHFGVLLGLPLIAIGLVVVIVYFVAGDEQPASAPATAPTPELDTSAAEPSQPVPPPLAPAAPPSAAPPPASAPAPPVAAPVPGPQLDAQAPAERFRDPKVREHAQLMVTQSARLALQQRSLERLQRLRDTTRQTDLEHVVAPSDLQAIDIGIDCLARANGFQARADDFFEDHPSSELNDVLRSVCQ